MFSCDFISHSPQGIRHAQAHGLERGKNSGDQTQRDAEAQPDEQIARGQKEHRQQAGQILSHDGCDRARQSQTNHSADDGEQARFGEHERDDLSVGETDGLEHAQFAGPLAHRLRHGVAGHQQDGEEHRAQNRRDDEDDVADLAGPALNERAFRLGLGFRR